MHARIKELLGQATTIEEYGWGASYENFDQEKFAELLIRDCAKQVNHVYKQGGGTYGETILKTYNLTFK